MIAIVSHCVAAEFISAKTRDGRVMLLYPDGTWKEVVNVPYDKEFIQGKKEKYRIAYQPEKWTAKKGKEGPLDIQFEAKGGDGWAMTVFERMEIPHADLSDMLVANAKKIATNVEMIESAKVMISGCPFLKIRLRATIEGIEFIYYGYCGSGEWGTLQFLCYTSKNIFEEFKPSFEELLKGLEINKT